MIRSYFKIIVLILNCLSFLQGWFCHAAEPQNWMHQNKAVRSGVCEYVSVCVCVWAFDGDIDPVVCIYIHMTYLFSNTT